MEVTKCGMSMAAVTGAGHGFILLKLLPYKSGKNYLRCTVGYTCSSRVALQYLQANYSSQSAKIVSNCPLVKLNS